MTGMTSPIADSCFPESTFEIDSGHGWPPQPTDVATSTESLQKDKAQPTDMATSSEIIQKDKADNSAEAKSKSYSHLESWL